jgi:hypothetical protein
MTCIAANDQNVLGCLTCLRQRSWKMRHGHGRRCLFERFLYPTRHAVRMGCKQHNRRQIQLPSHAASRETQRIVDDIVGLRGANLFQNLRRDMQRLFDQEGGEIGSAGAHHLIGEQAMVRLKERSHLL